MNKKNSILIIANGESALDENYGDIINDFSTIARINNYSIDGFEKYIGNKTDIWFNGANSKLKLRPKYTSKIIVLLPSERLIKKKNILNKYVSKRLNINPSTIVSNRNTTKKDFIQIENSKSLLNLNTLEARSKDEKTIKLIETENIKYTIIDF